MSCTVISKENFLLDSDWYFNRLYGLKLQLESEHANVDYKDHMHIVGGFLVVTPIYFLSL